MDKKQYEIFKKLTNKEARSFFILYVGLDYFLRGINLKTISKKQSKELLKRKNRIDLDASYSFRLLMTNHNKESIILYNNYNRKYACIDIEESNYGDDEFYTLANMPNELSDKVVSLLFAVVKFEVTGEDLYSQLRELKKYGGKSNDLYRFVLGAGVNSGYSMPSWKELENEFVNENCSLLSIDANEHEKIISNVFNNNYGTFQVTKDLSESAYKNALVNMVS